MMRIYASFIRIYAEIQKVLDNVFWGDYNNNKPQSMPPLNENSDISYYSGKLKPPDPNSNQKCEITGENFIPSQVYKENLDHSSEYEVDFVKTWFEDDYYFYYDENYYIEEAPYDEITPEVLENLKNIVISFVGENKNTIKEKVFNFFIFDASEFIENEDLIVPSYSVHLPTEKRIRRQVINMIGIFKNEIGIENPLCNIIFSKALNNIEENLINYANDKRFIPIEQALGIIDSEIYKFISNIENVIYNASKNINKKVITKTLLPKYISLNGFNEAINKNKEIVLCPICQKNYKFSKNSSDENEPCESCKEDMTVCDKCGEWISHEYSYYDENSEQQYCELCYNEVVEEKKIDIKNLADEDNMPLEALYEYFNDLEWDYLYGGPQWAKITKALINLKDSENYQNAMVWIDHIIDLQHNTGSIFNKNQQLNDLINDVIHAKTEFSLDDFYENFKNKFYPQIHNFFMTGKRWNSLREEEKLNRIRKRISGAPVYNKGQIDLQNSELTPEYYRLKENPAVSKSKVKIRKYSYTNKEKYNLNEKDLYSFYAMSLIDIRLIQIYPPMSNFLQFLINKIKDVFVEYLTTEVYEEALDTRYPRIPENGEIGGHLYHFLESNQYDRHASYNFDEFVNKDEDEDWYKELVEKSEKPPLAASFKNIFQKINILH